MIMPYIFKKIIKKVDDKLLSFILGLLSFGLCFLWTTYSYIQFDLSLYIVLLLLSFFSVTRLGQKLNYFNSLISNIPSKIGTIVILLLISFQLVGNRGVVYPLESTFTIGRLIELLCVAIWLFPILISSIYLINEFSWTSDSESRYNNMTFYFICISALIIPGILYLFAFNPGISSYDTWQCLLLYAHNIVGMPNWHPPFYVLFLKCIIAIWDSPYAVVIVQILMWAGVWCEALVLLRSQSIKDKLLIVFSIFVGTGIANCMNIVSIWKDIPYSVSILWLTILIAKMVLTKSELNYWHYIKLAIALVCVFFFRQNGIVVYLLTALVLVLVFKKSKKTIISLIVSIALIIFIRFPLYSFLQINEQNMSGMYIGLGQDLVGTYCAGGQLSEDSINIVKELVNSDLSTYNHNPYYASLSDNTSITMNKFIPCYIDTFIHNPRKMINAIMCRIDVIWDIMPGENSFENLINYQGHMDDIPEWVQKYPSFHVTPFYSPISSIAADSVEIELSLIVYWRVGIWLALILIVLFNFILTNRNRKVLLVFSPFIGQIISLLLSTGWADYRYYWSIILCIQFIILLLNSKGFLNDKIH